jgi:hypothetical protein
VEVRRRGPCARTTFVAGVVSWYGEQAPREADIKGLPVMHRGSRARSCSPRAAWWWLETWDRSLRRSTPTIVTTMSAPSITFGAGSRQSAMLKRRARIDPDSGSPRSETVHVEPVIILGTEGEGVSVVDVAGLHGSAPEQAFVQVSASGLRATRSGGVPITPNCQVRGRPGPARSLGGLASEEPTRSRKRR